MQEKDLWIPLHERKQYEMLGFHHDNSKLLFVPDYTKLNCFPRHQPRPDYLCEDINLTKSSSFQKKEFTLGKDNDDKSEFILQRTHCAGVKVIVYT